MGVTVDNVEDLQKQIAKLDRIMSKSLQRRGEIEQILFDVATGKLPPPSPQDCRVLALKLGTDKADWPEQIANHVWQGDSERDALAAQVEVLRISALNAIQSMAGGKAKADLRDAYDATPAACLAQVQAEAGRAGFVAGFIHCYEKSDDCLDALSAAKEYAERIRQEVEL